MGGKHAVVGRGQWLAARLDPSLTIPPPPHSAHKVLALPWGHFFFGFDLPSSVLYYHADDSVPPAEGRSRRL